MAERGCIHEAGCGKSYGLGGAYLVAGLAAGAVAMYFWDPNRGALRRGRLQQRAAGAVRRGGDEVTGRAGDLLNRAQGLVAKAGDWFECQEQVSDDVLAARVRSRMGHLTEHAHAIESSVKDGVVTMKGPFGLEKRRVLAGIWSIPGVRDVEVLPFTGAAV
jgi:hypothetical protein